MTSVTSEDNSTEMQQEIERLEATIEDLTIAVEDLRDDLDEAKGLAAEAQDDCDAIRRQFDEHRDYLLAVLDNESGRAHMAHQGSERWCREPVCLFASTMHSLIAKELAA